jgi:hypothetical protein
MPSENQSEYITQGVCQQGYTPHPEPNPDYPDYEHVYHDSSGAYKDDADLAEMLGSLDIQESSIHGSQTPRTEFAAMLNQGSKQNVFAGILDFAEKYPELADTSDNSDHFIASVANRYAVTELFKDHFDRSSTPQR